MLTGNLTSLNVDGRTRHLLASFRPSAKYPSVRHQVGSVPQGVARLSHLCTGSFLITVSVWV